jgi:hypothetical protein
VTHVRDVCVRPSYQEVIQSRVERSLFIELIENAVFGNDPTLSSALRKVDGAADDADKFFE